MNSFSIAYVTKITWKSRVDYIYIHGDRNSRYTVTDTISITTFLSSIFLFWRGTQLNAGHSSNAILKLFLWFIWNNRAKKFTFLHSISFHFMSRCLAMSVSFNIAKNIMSRTKRFQPAWKLLNWMVSSLISKHFWLLLDWVSLTEKIFRKPNKQFSHSQRWSGQNKRDDFYTISRLLTIELI